MKKSILYLKRSNMLFLFLAFIISSAFITGMKKKPDLFKIGYTFDFRAGHQSNPCGGIGEMCLDIGLPFSTKYPCHIPCWGAGNECGHKIEISFKLSAMPSEPSNPTQDAMMTRIDESSVPILCMPSRSFEVTLNDETWYVNIPSQTIYVNNFVTGQDVIYPLSDVTVTSTPSF
jgi:hypothetical protein